MTTRLSQTRVKGGDPSYLTLKDEMQARSTGVGTGGYMPPAGGIPKADMSQHVQDLLSLIETSTMIKTVGVTPDDLGPELEGAFEKVSLSYVKPDSGIPLADMEQSIQDRLSDFANFYVYPEKGIPRVDMDGNVNWLLGLAETAYQKPSGGIGTVDISKDLLDMILTGVSRYEFPAGGIPASDLKESYITREDYQYALNHIANDSIHITDHDKLLNIGNYTHRVIDEKLDNQAVQIADIWKEVLSARDEFSSVGNRLNSLLGLNAFYSVQLKEDWQRGKLENLVVNDEGFVGLTYVPEKPVMTLHAVEENGHMNDDNDIGRLMFETNSRIFLGTKPWQHTIDRRNQVGVSLQTNIYIDKSGTYEFATQFSGRVRLKIGSKLLYDTQGVYGQVDAYTRTNSIELEAGRLYQLTLEGWYGFEGDRVVGLTWKRPGANSFIEIAPEYFNNSGYLIREGFYESEIIDMKDNNISKWMFELNASDNRGTEDIIIQVRSSPDGLDWLDWMEIEDSGEILVTPYRYSQVRIRLKQVHQFYSPVIRGYRIRFISSTNNEIMNELSAARDNFVSLESRFLNIESMIVELTKFIELQNKNLFHPEFFASVRLAAQELNLLRMVMYEAERQVDFILLEHGVVDPLKTANFIDDTKSDKYELVGTGIRALRSTKRLEGNAEWANWELDNLDYVNGSLRLDYSTTSPVSSTTAFNNWYLWSTRDTARLADNYQAHIAQPFYTGDNTNLITRLQLQTYDVWNQPQTTFMICETIEGGDLPNVSNPVWAVTNWSTGAISFANLRVPVKPKTKYWIVLKREALQSVSGYSRWYLSYNNTSTNDRLRGTNPESKYMYVKYTADAQGKTGWLTDSGYFLSFIVNESYAYVSNGTGSRILDYGEKVNFVSADITQTLASENITDISYQASNDALVWSKEETNIDVLPEARFLKINVNMKKSSSTQGSPTISRIDVRHVLTHADVVTHAMDSKSIPTHAIYQAAHDEGITFFVSRDDGVSWKEMLQDEYTQLDDIMPGNSVRFKMRFDGHHPDSFVQNYAVSFTTYRDITQQNVTALYEEYIAEEAQTVFKLRDPYVLGNHSLHVYLNGIRQSLFKDYLELDRYTIQFTEPLIGGLDADRVTFFVATGAYDQHDAVMHQKIEEAQERAQALNVSHSKEHVYDENNRLVATVFNPQYYIQRYDYEYDDNNRKIKEIKTTKTYIEVIEYNYNENGFLINESVNISEVKN